jgi:hypothetical protein
MSPNDFYDTNVLPKKFVTDAILLIENISDQPHRTKHSLKKTFSRTNIMVDVKKTCKIKGVLSGALLMNSSLISQAL